jgi:hypothetical protein
MIKYTIASKIHIPFEYVLCQGMSSPLLFKGFNGILPTELIGGTVWSPRGGVKENYPRLDSVPIFDESTCRGSSNRVIVGILAKKNVELADAGACRFALRRLNSYSVENRETLLRDVWCFFFRV